MMDPEAHGNWQCATVQSHISIAASDVAQHLEVQGNSAHLHRSSRVVEGINNILAAVHGGGTGNAAGGQAQAAAQATRDVQYRRAVGQI